MAVIVTRDIVPLFAIDKVGGHGTLGDFLGTGFVVADGVLVTCWHVVSKACASGVSIVALISGNADTNVKALTDVAPNPAGHDMATARVDMASNLKWSLAAPDPGAGIDVCTYGYPLPRQSRPVQGDLGVDPRYLEGYVMRTFSGPMLNGVTSSSYELDMHAPAGLSGAPLIRRGSRELMGVVYGSRDSYTIEEWASVDLDTGRRTPEVQRLISFALATHLGHLCDLRGPATENRPLRAILQVASPTPVPVNPNALPLV